MPPLDFNAISKDIAAVLAKHGLIEDEDSGALKQIDFNDEFGCDFGSFLGGPRARSREFTFHFVSWPAMPRDRRPHADFESDAEEVVDPEALPAPRRLLNEG